MKILSFLCLIFISHILIAQDLQLSANEILIDTVPHTFQYSASGVMKHKRIKLQCTVSGKSPVTIKEVRRHQYGYSGKVEHSEINSFPDVCQPGVTYDMFFFYSGNDSCSFEFVTDCCGSEILKVISNKTTFLVFDKVAPDSYWGAEGVQKEVKYQVRNTSAKPVHVDSIRQDGDQWACKTSFPFVIAPGETTSILLVCDGDPGLQTFCNVYLAVYFHPQDGFEDYIRTVTFIHIYHRVVILSGGEKHFGTIQKGAILSMKVTVRNDGLKVFDLTKNNSAYVTTTKTQLAPGDTAVCLVQWNPEFAGDSFITRLPLFLDTRNGKSTAIMLGPKQHSSSMFSANADRLDSMIWVETDSSDLGTLQRSQGSIEKTFRCRNDSPVPILVRRVNTGDGGSMAWCNTRDTIFPGEEFSITFKQDLSSRLGPFHRAITISVTFLGLTHSFATKIIQVQGLVKPD